MMQVLMIRHSFAADPGSVPGGDSARPLTERGRSVFTRTAEWLKSRGVVPERILYSPLVRARQTAEILAGATGQELDPGAAQEWIASGMTVERLLGELQGEMAESVAIVGHEPRMSRCTSAMIAGGRLRFFPGTVAGVTFDGLLREGQGILDWMLSPQLFFG